MPRLGRAVCAAIFFGALALRLAAIAATGFSTVHFADASSYLVGARALAATGHYPLRTDAYLFRPPGYAFFLAAATLGHPDATPAAKIATAATGALGAVLVAALSARIFRRRGVAIAAGALAAVHPMLVLVSTDLQSESLFIVLLLSAGYLLLAATDRPSSNLAVLAGASLALAALTRSSALALVPLLLAPLWDGRHPRRANVHIVFSALLGFGLTLVPWTLRNALVFRELILVNDGAGYVFYGRNADAALPLTRARDRAELQAATDALEAKRLGLILTLPDEVRSSPGKLSRALTARALSERRADPRGTVRLLAWKAWDWLRPYPDPRYWPRPAVLAMGAYMTALLVFGGIGLARAPRPGVSAFCLVFLAATLLFHVALETNWRYRTANWDPVLLLYGSFGAATLRSARRGTGTA